MAVRLIALDLDGTALIDHHILSDRTRASIKAALGLGIFVIPATGRSYWDIPKRVREISGIPYFLTSNGANVVDGKTKKSIYTDLIPWRESVEILRLLEHYDVQPSVHLNGSSSNLKSADLRVVKRYGNTDYFSRRSVDNLADFVAAQKADVEKIFAVVFDPDEKEKLVEHFSHAYDLAVTASGRDNIELNSPTASKGQGLSVLCSRLGIAAEEVAVIGDSKNDISMYRFAGVKIAMGNAEACIQGLSQYVTEPCEREGAALAIEKILQGQWQKQ